MDLFYLDRVLDGETSCFSYFIEKYKDMAFSIAFRITGNEQDAEESVQDAFVKSFRSISTFRRQAAFSTWLYKIVVNTSLTKVKKRKAPIHEVDIAGISDDNVKHVDEVYKTLENMERKRLVNDALQKMEIEDSLLLTLYYLAEKSIEEIAVITSIKADNIKMKLHRARKKLYIILEKNLHTELKNIL